MNKLLQVAVVGRMNVGKSTLFNRLSERKKSLTLDYEGVTRDTIKDSVTWKDREFTLVDTGGLICKKSNDPITQRVQEKAVAALIAADAVIFVVDGTTGVLSEDSEISQLLRSHGKKTVLVVNKADVRGVEDELYVFSKLHHTSMVPISAEHGRNIHDMLDAVIALLPQAKASEEEGKPAYKVVFLGRPNVGKSSLMNALLKEDRSIVSPVPGTTREAVSERIQMYQEHLEITDTPGIRRSRAIDDELESLMVKMALRAAKDADIVVLLLDATEATIVDQELKLAFYAFSQLHKALIVLINKVDAVGEHDLELLQESLTEYQYFTKKIEMMQISCKSGKNIGRVLPLIKKVWERHSQQLPAEELARTVLGALRGVSLMHKKQRLIVHYVHQCGVAPITIKLRVNVPLWFGPSQLTFFENVIRKHYDLVGVPIRFITYAT